eukprot:COSAG01_NODE_26578_length_709_cov_1.449180_1_plen_83_part_10
MDVVEDIVEVFDEVPGSEELVVEDIAGKNRIMHMRCPAGMPLTVGGATSGDGALDAAGDETFMRLEPQPEQQPRQIISSTRKS